MFTPIELPLAVAGCGLDQAQLAQQLSRYQRLGAGAVVTRPSRLVLTAQFAGTPDRELLTTTLETERECCSFFALEYSEPQRRLTVSVSDPARIPALDEIASALSGTQPAASEQQS